MSIQNTGTVRLGEVQDLFKDNHKPNKKIRVGNTKTASGNVLGG